jgi:hypothetical protein
MSTKIRTSKIKSFLKSVTNAEYIYLNHCIEMRNAITNLIKTHNLTPEDICIRFSIKTEQYENFISGAYNYSIMDMAALNVAFVELESESLKENPPFKVAGEK